MRVGVKVKVEMWIEVKLQWREEPEHLVAVMEIQVVG